MRIDPGANQVDRLFQAIKDGDAEKVTAMFAAGMPTTVVSSTQQSALLAAVDGKDVGVMAALLEAGVDIHYAGTGDLYTKAYGTPLNYACAHGVETAIEFLLGYGSNATINSEVGGNAAHHMLGYASAKARLPAASIERFLSQMLDAGMSADSCDNIGLSLLGHVITCNLPASTVELLLDRGANPCLLERNGGQPIHKAVGSSRMDVVQALISRGASVNAADSDYETPLFRADSPQILDELLALGADMAHQNIRGHNLIHAWISANTAPSFPPTLQDNEAMLLHILARGADARQTDILGDCALDILESETIRDMPSAQRLRAAINVQEARRAMRMPLGAAARPS